MRLVEVEEKFKNTQIEKLIWAKEREGLLGDFRTRETQLKNLNKVHSI
jgi:hypothetical protein